MKANELMIGDWVTNKTLTHFEKIDEDFFVGILTRKYEISEILPIPLTPEILEKNGFSWGLTTNQEDMLGCGLGVPVTAEKSWVWEDEDGGEGVVCINFPNKADGGQIWCDNNGKCDSLIWDSDISVHELQHALRLCGLTELADNFQLPELLKEDMK